jgi:hypothetical protein
MNRDLFWLTDAQFSKIDSHLPTDTRGKAALCKSVEPIDSDL